jgi:hypothetical protein
MDRAVVPGEGRGVIKLRHGETCCKSTSFVTEQPTRRNIGTPGAFGPPPALAFERTRKPTDFEGSGASSGLAASSELMSGNDPFHPLISDFSSRTADFGEHDLKSGVPAHKMIVI